MSSHGAAYYGNYGCRCRVCKAGKAAWAKGYNRQRRADRTRRGLCRDCDTPTTKHVGRCERHWAIECERRRKAGRRGGDRE